MASFVDMFKSFVPQPSYKYSALPLTRGGRVAEPGDSVWARQNRRLLKFSMAGTFLILLLYFVVSFRRVASCETSGSCAKLSHHLWGQYSPYFPVQSDINPKIPKGCTVSFVQALVRHGARSPTAHMSTTYNQTIQHIQSSVTDYGKGYEFIRDYKYTLGADLLVPFGISQLKAAGNAFFGRYRDLSSTADPFIRASGQDRVIQSAIEWTKAFYEAQMADNQRYRVGDGNGGEKTGNIVIIPETTGTNNTLNHGLCTAFEDGPYSHIGDQAQAVWANIFVPPILERLNRNLPGANLSIEQAIRIMDLCPFEFVASPKTPDWFCSLFDADEWRSYDYYQSLGKYYGFNAGNPLGPTQGVGWVNELLARLTGRPVEDHTSSNATLDASPQTFPLGRAVYADFSHDNDMTTVFGALGLYDATGPLSKTQRTAPGAAGGYSAAWTVPFAGRMYVEKMRCEDGESDPGQELVRILVNERVVPLRNCGADAWGRCTLERFVESMSFARGGGRWDECYQ